MIGERAFMRMSAFGLGAVAVGILTLSGDVSARKFPHIQTAGIAYSASEATAAKWYAKHYDMLISGPQAYVDSMQRYDSSMYHLTYILFSSLQFGFPSGPSQDSIKLVNFCASKGYNVNDFVLHTGPSDTVILQSGWPGPAIVDTTLPNRWLVFYDWNTRRYVPDYRNPHMGEWWWYKYKTEKQADPTLDGVMEDEAACISNSQYGGPILTSQMFPWGVSRQWYNSTTQTWVTLPIWIKGNPSKVGWGATYAPLTSANFSAMSDSIVRAKWGWIGAVSDSFSSKGQVFFRNPAAYYDNYNPGQGRTYRPNDFEGDQFKGSRRVNNLLGEGCYLTPTINPSRNKQYLDYVQQIVDSGATCALWVLMYKQDTVNLGSLARTQMERLCYYYMAGDPDLTWFCLTGNEVPPTGLSSPNDFHASDTLIRWWPALQYDIGRPQAVYFSAATGTDPTGQSYSIYRRDYTKAAVLWRGSNLPTSTDPTKFNSTTAVTYNLNGLYRQLFANGTLGDTVRAAVIRNGEGLIFVPYGGGTMPSDTIPPGTVNDMGVVPGSQHGDAVLAWTAPGDDGSSGTAASYQIRYALWPITQANWTSATIVANAPVPAPAGTPQSLTVSNLVPGGKYYFGIKAMDDVSNSSTGFSPPGFAAGIATPAPILTQVDSSTGSVTVTATTVPSYLPLSYEFAIDTVSHFTNPTTKSTSNLGTSTEASMDFGNLDETTNYFWRCRAVSASPVDSSNWSNSIQFNLLVNVIRTLVDSDLVVPKANQVFTSLRPIFEVASVPNVAHVYFQVDSTAFFLSPILSGTIATVPDSATHWQVSEILSENTTWHVRASSDNVVWTSPVAFSVGTANPAPFAYPNPYRPESGHLTFANIPTGSDLVILTMSGDVVRKYWNLTTPQTTWDGRNESGNAVAAGVYLWQVDPAKKSGKIIVVR